MVEGPNSAGRSVRWLQAFQILLILFSVAAVLGCVAILGALVVQLVSGYSWPVSVTINRTVDAGDTLPPGVEPTGHSEIMINDPTLGQSALRTASLVLALAVAIIVAGYLTRTVQTAIAGEPFSQANLRRVRVIGLLLLFGGLAGTLNSMVTPWLIARISLGDTAGSPVITEPPTLALAGVIVLAVAEMMRQGATLRAELDEVV